MTRHARDILSTAILLIVVGSPSSSARPITGDISANESETQILIAGAGQAGMGAQTAAQSSAASSAGSNAAASTITPATTPSSSAGRSPGQSGSPGVSNQSFLPNSSSSNVNAPTSPNGPATSAPVSTGDNNSSTSAPNKTLPTMNNLSPSAGQSANSTSNQSTNAPRTGAVSASNGGPTGKSNFAQSAPNSAQLRGVIGSPADASTGQSDNSVESFFQVNAARSGPGYQIINSSTSGSSPSANHSALWHIMDNLGVPVPTGNNIESLDPTLRRNYVNPELPNINNYKTRSGKNQTASRGYESPPVTSTQTPVPTAINMQKIPASELEGVDYSAKNDDQNKQR